MADVYISNIPVTSNNEKDFKPFLTFDEKDIRNLKYMLDLNISRVLQ